MYEPVCYEMLVGKEYYAALSLILKHTINVQYIHKYVDTCCIVTYMLLCQIIFINLLLRPERITEIGHERTVKLVG